ncbi:hypothetical protein [Spiribacter roseus]|uniref:LEPR-XLL domain-containing protein n=1 Tax=Spiribacter roseus TaxID=1855875 RepID=A0ABV3RZH8_9GAMM
MMKRLAHGVGVSRKRRPLRDANGIDTSAIRQLLVRELKHPSSKLTAIAGGPVAERAESLLEMAQRHRKALRASGGLLFLLAPLLANAQEEAEYVDLRDLASVVDATLDADGNVKLELADGSVVEVQASEVAIGADGQILVTAGALTVAGVLFPQWAVDAGSAAVESTTQLPANSTQATPSGNDAPADSEGGSFGMLGGALGGVALLGAAAGGGGGGGGGSASTPTAPSTPDPGTSGLVVDGYIEGATVFRDLDEDGEYDSNEPSEQTNAEGRYSGLTGDRSKPIVSLGGTDQGTGLEVPGAFTAPAGWEVVSPLNTLVQARISNNGESAAEAESAVKELLGLDQGKDPGPLSTTDPIADDNLDLIKAGVQVANAMSIAADAVDGNAEAKAEAASAVAKALAAAEPGHGEVLGSQNLESTLKDTLESLGIAPSAVLQEIQKVNQDVDRAGSAEDVFDVQGQGLEKAAEQDLSAPEIDSLDAASLESIQPGGTAQVRFAFTEAAKGFDIDDITLSGTAALEIVGLTPLEDNNYALELRLVENAEVSGASLRFGTGFEDVAGNVPNSETLLSLPDISKKAELVIGGDGADFETLTGALDFAVSGDALRLGAGESAEISSAQIGDLNSNSVTLSVGSDGDLSLSDGLDENPVDMSAISVDGDGRFENQVENATALASGSVLGDLAINVVTGGELTLTATQADGRSIFGEGDVIVTELAGAASMADLSGLASGGGVALQSNATDGQFSGAIQSATLEVTGGSLDISGADITGEVAAKVSSGATLKLAAAQLEQVTVEGGDGTGYGELQIRAMPAAAQNPEIADGLATRVLIDAPTDVSQYGDLTWLDEVEISDSGSLTLTAAQLDDLGSDKIDGSGELRIEGLGSSFSQDLSGLSGDVRVTVDQSVTLADAANLGSATIKLADGAVLTAAAGQLSGVDIAGDGDLVLSGTVDPAVTIFSDYQVNAIDLTDATLSSGGLVLPPGVDVRLLHSQLTDDQVVRPVTVPEGSESSSSLNIDVSGLFSDSSTTASLELDARFGSGDDRIRFDFGPLAPGEDSADRKLSLTGTLNMGAGDDRFQVVNGTIDADQVLEDASVEDIVINSNLQIAADAFATLLDNIDELAESRLAGAGVITVTGDPEDLGDGSLIDLGKLGNFERGGVTAPTIELPAEFELDVHFSIPAEGSPLTVIVGGDADNPDYEPTGGFAETTVFNEAQLKAALAVSVSTDSNLRTIRLGEDISASTNINFDVAGQTNIDFSAGSLAVGAGVTATLPVALVGGARVRGEGAVQITNATTDSLAGADLSDISAGSVKLALSDQGELDVRGVTLGDIDFSVPANAELTLSASSLDGVAVGGLGDVVIQVNAGEAAALLSRLAVVEENSEAPSVIARFTESMNFTGDLGDSLSEVQISEETVSLTADLSQFDGRTVTGPGSLDLLTGGGSSSAVLSGVDVGGTKRLTVDGALNFSGDLGEFEVVLAEGSELSLSAGQAAGASIGGAGRLKVTLPVDAGSDPDLSQVTPTGGVTLVVKDDRVLSGGLLDSLDTDGPVQVEVAAGKELSIAAADLADIILGGAGDVSVTGLDPLAPGLDLSGLIAGLRNDGARKLGITTDSDLRDINLRQSDLALGDDVTVTLSADQVSGRGIEGSSASADATVLITDVAGGNGPDQTSVDGSVTATVLRPELALDGSQDSRFTDDNIINRSEIEAGITLSGTVSTKDAGNEFDTSHTVRVTAGDYVIEEVAEDDGSWSVILPSAVLGSLADEADPSIEVTALNGLGNALQNPQVLEFEIDLTPPDADAFTLALSGDTGQEGTFLVGDTLDVTVEESDANQGSVSFKADLTDFGIDNLIGLKSDGGGGFELPDTPLTAADAGLEGAETDTARVRILAADDAGNETILRSGFQSVDRVPPSIADNAISLSGASGSNGTFIVGDTLTVSIAGRDVTNLDGGGVTADLSDFGGDSAVELTQASSGNPFSAELDLSEGPIDIDTAQITVTATDDAGNAVTQTTTEQSVDLQSPGIAQDSIVLGGATGASGAFIVGDTLTVSIAASEITNLDGGGVVADLSDFGGGAAVELTQDGSGEPFTAALTLAESPAESPIDTDTAEITVTATDDAGNAVTRTTAEQSVDLKSPGIGSGSIGLSGATGTNGTFIVGDTLTVSIAASDITNLDDGEVVVDLSDFGGGAVVVLTQNDSDDPFTAELTLDESPAESPIDTDTAEITVTATDDAGNAVTRTAAGQSVDLESPGIAPDSISLSGATGSNDAFIVGDTLTVSIAASDVTNLDGGEVVADLSAFGGDSAVTLSGSQNSSEYSTTLALREGSVETENADITVTARDDAGNEATQTSSATTVDRVSPTSPVIEPVAGDNRIDESEFPFTPTLSGDAEAGAAIALEVFAGREPEENATPLLSDSLTVPETGQWAFTAAESARPQALPNDYGDGDYTAVIGITDANGNVGPTETRVIELEARAPEVVSATLSDARLTQADAGDVVTLEVAFSEAMDQSQPVSVQLESAADVLREDADSGRWVADDRYALDYSVIEPEENVADIRFSLSQAQDLSSKPMSDEQTLSSGAQVVVTSGLLGQVGDIDDTGQDPTVTVGVLVDPRELADPLEFGALEFSVLFDTGAVTYVADSAAIQSSAESDQQFVEAVDVTESNTESNQGQVNFAAIADPAVSDFDQALITFDMNVSSSAASDPVNLDLSKVSVDKVALGEAQLTFDPTPEPSSAEAVVLSEGGFLLQSDQVERVELPATADGSGVRTLDGFTVGDTNGDIIDLGIDETDLDDRVGDEYRVIDDSGQVELQASDGLLIFSAGQPSDESVNQLAADLVAETSHEALFVLLPGENSYSDAAQSDDASLLRIEASEPAGDTASVTELATLRDLESSLSSLVDENLADFVPVSG